MSRKHLSSRIKEPTKQLKPRTSFKRDAAGLMMFYNIIHAEQSIYLPPHLIDPCHALMDDRITKLMLILGPGAGKSKLTSVVYPAFMIGTDPTTTILGISAGESLMSGFQNSVGDYIRNSPIWRRYFPDVKPDYEKGWSSERGLFVTGHRAGDPDANYFACGLSSSALTGKHARILNCDDLHNKENAASTMQCQKVWDDYYKTIIGRQDPQGAKIIVTGRRWNLDDLYGHLIGLGEYVVMELPAIREKTDKLYWDITVPLNPKTGKPLDCCFTDGSLDNIQYA